MTYLIDTNVVSELRKGRRCDAALAAWYSEVPREDVFLSVLTVGEVRNGIERIRRRDPRSAQVLDAWLAEVIATQEERILPVDEAVADRWGRFGIPDPLPPIDGLLAATASVHGLTLVTRNVRDVERTGVPCLNPFAG